GRPFGALPGCGGPQAPRPRSLLCDAGRIPSPVAAAGAARGDRPGGDGARPGRHPGRAAPAEGGPARRRRAPLHLWWGDGREPGARPAAHRLRLRRALRSPPNRRRAGDAERGARGSGSRGTRAGEPTTALLGGRDHRPGRDGHPRGALRRGRSPARPHSRPCAAPRWHMTQALLVSNVVLWVAVVLLAGVVAALVRQIGVLYERVAPAGALMIARGPAVGEAGPVVRAEDLSGTPHDVGGARPDGRSTLLFFLSPTCPVCKTLLPVLRSIGRAEADWLEIVLAGDGTREEHAAFVAQHRLERFSYVLSPTLRI